ncbi:MAG: glycosyltransferase [Gemmatimonadaceae bacterium]
MTCWAAIAALHAAGHEIDLYLLEEGTDTGNTPERRALLDPYVRRIHSMPMPTDEDVLRDRGSTSLWSRIRDRLVAPPMDVLFPAFTLRDLFAEQFKAHPVDLVFCYHWSAAAATHGLHPAPKMIATGDLWHRPSVARWELMKREPTFTYLKATMSTFVEARHRIRGMITLLNDGDDVGSFGRFDAGWLRRHGAANSRHFLTPIEDAAGDDWAAHRTDGSRKKFKIITAISNLQSTSTRSAMSFVATELIPALERELGRDAFEVHVIGTGTPPPEMTALLPRPDIVIRGYVADIHAEFNSADVVLQPTPVFLGFRVRIITASSFGCCVVAHENDAINMPEMITEQNVLLANNGPDMVRALLRVYRDPPLRRRLGEGARKTYEEFFHPRVAGARLVQEMEQLAVARRASSA